MDPDRWEDQDAVDELKDQVHSDIATRVGAFDGSMLVKYVALIEVISDDGERALLALTSKDIKAWETLGMFEYMRQLEQAGAVRDEED